MPPPTAVRLAVDLRPSADGSAVRTSLVAGQLQAASVPIALAAAPERRTDGRMAGSLNAHRRKLLLGPGAQAPHFYDHEARLYDEPPTFVT